MKKFIIFILSLVILSGLFLKFSNFDEKVSKYTQNPAEQTEKLE